MVKDKGLPSGQISFRLDAELQTTLYEIARELNFDVSGLVKAMIAEQLPDWVIKANQMKRKRFAARYRVEEGHVPLVHVAMLGGLGKGPKERVKAMRSAVEDVSRLDAGPMQAVLVAAGHELAHIDIEIARENESFDYIEQVVIPEIRGRD